MPQSRSKTCTEQMIKYFSISFETKSVVSEILLNNLWSLKLHRLFSTVPFKFCKCNLWKIWPRRFILWFLFNSIIRRVQWSHEFLDRKCVIKLPKQRSFSNLVIHIKSKTKMWLLWWHKSMKKPYVDIQTVHIILQKWHTYSTMPFIGPNHHRDAALW